MNTKHLTLALLAATTIPACGLEGMDGESPLETKSAAGIYNGPPIPIPYLGYVASELEPLLGGTSSEVHAIGTDGRAVGQAQGCFFYLGQPQCNKRAVYWDVGQGAATALPVLANTASNTSVATGITDAGVIVGTRREGNTTRGWRWSAATGISEITLADGTPLITQAAASNGWTTGQYFPPGKDGSHAFRYSLSSGYFEDLYVPCVRTLLQQMNMTSLIPAGHKDGTDCLNDFDLVRTAGVSVDVLGNVVGFAQAGAGGPTRGFLWRGGGAAVDLYMLNLEVQAAVATAVNGTVVGPYTAWDGVTTRTFSYSGLDGGLLGDMGLSASVDPHGLSSMGRLVGQSSTGTKRPVTAYGSSFTYLGVPNGWTLGSAVAVNRCGSVVGNAEDANHQQHAIRWVKSACD